MTTQYNDSRDGIIHTAFSGLIEWMMVMDDFGSLIRVNWCLDQSWYQPSDLIEFYNSFA